MNGVSMRVRERARSLLIVAGIIVLAGCSGAIGVAGVSGDPYVRGPVVDITHHATSSGMRVDAGPGSREACGIVATLDARTRYYARGATGELMRIRISEIEIGDTVEVYVDGAVAESCPVQAYAGAIVLVS